MATTTTTRAPAATLGTADYGRISTDEGHDEKGVQRQTAKNRARIAREPGWHHAGSYVDNDLSASKGEPRPRFEALLDAVRRGEVQVIVCYMSGRLLRNRRERMEAGELFAAHGVRVVCTDGLDLDYSTPAGRMMAGILGEVDAHEVEQSSERIKASKAQAAREGRSAGGRCFGYRPDPLAPKHRKRRLVVPAEAEVIREARDRLFKGDSLRSITLDFDGRGLKPLYGEHWSQSSLREIMLNPSIAGRRVHHGEDIGEADWEAIINYEDHLKLTKTLAARTMPEEWSAKIRHMLSGIALCGKCAAERGKRVTVIGRAPQEHRGTRFPRSYQCQDKPVGCRSLRRNADFVDDLVEGHVLVMLAEPGVVGSLLVAGAPDAKEVLALQRSVDGCQARAAAIGAEMAEVDPTDKVARTAYRTAMEKLRLELDGLHRRQAQMSRFSAVGDLAEGLLGARDICQFWAHGMTLMQKRAVIGALVEVTILPAGRGRPSGPEHIKIERKVAGA